MLPVCMGPNQFNHAGDQGVLCVSMHEKGRSKGLKRHLVVMLYDSLF